MTVLETEKQIRETARRLFEEDTVDVFIGYKQGTLPLRSAPHIVAQAEEAESLVWNSYCLNNLAIYLPRIFRGEFEVKGVKGIPRVGILAKGCDGRSIVGLIKERQVPRESLYIVAVSCHGMMDARKARERSGQKDIVEAYEEGEEIALIIGKGNRRIFKRAELLANACLNCQYPTPKLYDLSLGDREPQQEKMVSPTRSEEIEEKPAHERWRYFEAEISKCIRCYGCRQACPNCYCKVCFAEQTKPRWIGITDNLSDTMLYHIGRMLHQAGRCVDCGACIRACPMGLDLRAFSYKIVKDVKELFRYEAGLSLEEADPLGTFSVNDTQEFITEP